MVEKNNTLEVAKWVENLKYEDIPENVREECKNQILSVLGSIYAGSRTESCQKIIKSLSSDSQHKSHSILTTNFKTTLEDALLANFAMNMVLDYDDYLIAGHTGHSSVLIPLTLSEIINISGKDFILAQTIANEIEARLGLSAILGPLNGQGMSFIHSAGSACAYAKLTGLNAKQIASALDISLFQPSYTVMSGFFSGDTKLVTASFPALQGLYAAKLAKSNIRTSEDILENEEGFIRTFSYTPLFSAFDDLGSTWLSNTLSYKVHPGCAYLSSALDCIFEIIENNTINIDDVDQITVSAGIMTIKMEEAVKPYIKGSNTPSVALNFCTPYNISVALIDGKLGPEQFTEERVSDEKVWKLAEKVKVRHEAKYSELLIQNLKDLINFNIVAKNLNVKTVWELISRIGISSSFLNLLKIPDIKSQLENKDYKNNGSRNNKSFFKSDPSLFQMAFSSAVKITMKNGKVTMHEQIIPKGAAGNTPEDKRSAVIEKFKKEAAYTISERKVESLLEEIFDFENLDNNYVKQLIKSLSS